MSGWILLWRPVLFRWPALFEIFQRLAQPLEVHLLELDGEVGDQAEVEILFAVRACVGVGAPARLACHASHREVWHLLPILQQSPLMLYNAHLQIFFHRLRGGEGAKEDLEQ